jgi:hypothetical protein
VSSQERIRYWTLSGLLNQEIEEERDDGGPSIGDQLRRISERRAIANQAIGYSPQSSKDMNLYLREARELEEAERRLITVAKANLIHRLGQGDWVATGYRSPDEPRTPIPMRHWHFLEVDFESQRASGHGLDYFGIHCLSPRDWKRITGHQWHLDPVNQAPRQRTAAESQPPAPPPPESYRTGASGRPSSRHLVQAEFERRVASGTALGTLAEEAAHLVSWLAEAHPSAPPMTEKTIRNTLRESHRAYLRARNLG